MCGTHCDQCKMREGGERDNERMRKWSDETKVGCKFLWCIHSQVSVCLFFKSVSSYEAHYRIIISVLFIHICSIYVIKISVKSYKRHITINFSFFLLKKIEMEKSASMDGPFERRNWANQKHCTNNVARRC